MRTPTTTAHRLRHLVAQHPEWTTGRLARALKVSQPRVYQLLQRDGYRREWRLRKEAP